MKKGVHVATVPGAEASKPAAASSVTPAPAEQAGVGSVLTHYTQLFVALATLYSIDFALKKAFLQVRALSYWVVAVVVLPVIVL